MAPENMGAASTAPTFDARAWFADWTDHGGIAVHTGDHLFVSRATGLDRKAAQRLNALRAALHRPGAGKALAALLAGETEAQA